MLLTLRSRAVLIVLASGLLLSATSAVAQRPDNPSAQRGAVAQPGAAGPVTAGQALGPERMAVDSDARATRQQLDELLERYPPAVGRVLKLDPSLMTNQSYLATYPALATFLSQHPEVAHNPAFFLENVRISTSPSYAPETAETVAIRMWNQMLGGLAGLVVFAVVTGTLIWLIKTLIDYRRWNKLSKVQAEVHTKLLERFANNEELLTYIQTPAGRRFLESAPIPLEPEPRRMGAPFSRILWSVQAGAVLGVAGLGLLFVSTRVMEEVSQFIFAIGVLSLAVGAGFGVSAVISYMLSRKLGLFEPPAPDHA